jgi:adenylate cyclase
MIAMRRPSPRTALTLLFVALGIAWGGFLGARHLAGVGSALDQLENLSLDWRYSLVGPRIPPSGVVIAAIGRRARFRFPATSWRRSCAASRATIRR